MTYNVSIPGLNVSHVESLKHIVRPFSPTELAGLATAMSTVDLTDADLAVLNAVMANASESLHNMAR